MIRRHIPPSPPLRGRLSVPGDKSISHRAVLLNLCAPGDAKLRGLSTGDDVQRSLGIARALGATLQRKRDVWHLTAPRQLTQPKQALDCGNSGTTLRLVTGLLAPTSLTDVTLTGDTSLRRRPMKRLFDPLEAMGGHVHRAPDGSVCVSGAPLSPLVHRSNIASAQVKTALLLAARDCGIVVHEPRRSRDHSERMLHAMGAEFQIQSDGALCLKPSAWSPIDMNVPGDVSSAAFWMVAASLVAGSEVVLDRVGLNPTRTGIVDALRQMGARIDVERVDDIEPFGRIVVRASPLHGTTVEGELALRTLDELPILAVAAAFAEGTTIVRDAGELRVKESDRIASTVSGLRALGVEAEELPDGLVVHGGKPTQCAVIRAPEDHRIAMAFAIAGMASTEGVDLQGVESVQTSYPEFFQQMEALTRGLG